MLFGAVARAGDTSDVGVSTGVRSRSSEVERLITRRVFLSFARNRCVGGRVQWSNRAFDDMATNDCIMPRACIVLLLLATCHGYYIPGTFPKEFAVMDDLPGALADSQEAGHPCVKCLKQLLLSSAGHGVESRSSASLVTEHDALASACKSCYIEHLRG